MPPSGAESPAKCVAWFYRDEQGVVHGPSVIETLCTLWRCGELTGATPVKPENAARFVRIRDAPALQQLLQTLALAPAEQESSSGLDALLDCAAESAQDFGGAVQHAPVAPPAAPPPTAWSVTAERAALEAERAALARAREQLRQDLEAFERYRVDALAIITAKRALLAE